MNVLGMHFGHDGSVSIVSDGAVRVVVESERLTRLKHSIGLGPPDIQAALNTLGMSIEEIDYCAITTTQQIEYVFDDPSSLSFRYAPELSNLFRCGLDTEAHATVIKKFSREYLRTVVERGGDHPYLNRIPNKWKFGGIKHSLPTFEEYLLPPKWQSGTQLSSLNNLLLDNPLAAMPRQSMHFPVAAKILGSDIQGICVSHHFAHAASSFYMSNYKEACVLSHDGSLPGTGYLGGMFYFGEGTKLWPLAPHHLALAHLYERVAVVLDLGLDTGAGKLMGLAPYGKPVFFDPKFVGNIIDGADVDIAPYDNLELPSGIRVGQNPQFDKWIRHCIGRARDLGYNLDPLGDCGRILEQINVDVAASTQKLFEVCMLSAAASLRNMTEGIGKRAENLCLTGGAALNCPTNSLLGRESGFANVHVAPYVHDGGLSIGAALALTHNVFDIARTERRLDVVENAYLGVKHEYRDIERELERLPANAKIVRGLDVARVAAEYLAADKIVGWFMGRSEIGPRALGNRSILAHPGKAGNWKRVNEIKKREHWRPFAPAVLVDQAEKWFAGIKFPSPYMLFNANVLQDTIPAVTHVDGSARVQTVDISNGAFHKLIIHFAEMTGIPVVLNTSFNGPGEPIVEMPAEAIKLFLESDLDALFLEDILITKA